VVILTNTIQHTHTVRGFTAPKDFTVGRCASFFHFLPLTFSGYLSSKPFTIYLHFFLSPSLFMSVSFVSTSRPLTLFFFLRFPSLFLYVFILSLSLFVSVSFSFFSVSFIYPPFSSLCTFLLFSFSIS